MEWGVPESVALQAVLAVLFYIPMLRWFQNKQMTRPPPSLARRRRALYNLVQGIRHVLETRIEELEVPEPFIEPSDESYCPAYQTPVPSVQMMLSFYENEDGPWDKERYLCLSDGFAIHCLDLKCGKSKGHGFDLQPLPEFGTLKLLELGLPVSMGLFKLGSDVLMVSGQAFPSVKYHPDLKLPLRLYERYGFKGSSRKTYRLSLSACGLSVFPCDIPLLNKPKFWPIVEKIGRQLHVIESLPGCFETPHTIPSHEVLNLDDPCASWLKLTPMRNPENESYGLFIADHLLVGDRIYAKPYGHDSEFFVFDLKFNKWEWHCGECSGLIENAISVKTLVKPGYEEPLHVLIQIAETREENETRIWAVAYLVTSKLQVICYQELPHFCMGLKGCEGFKGLAGQVCLFVVDEEEEIFTAVVRGLHDTDSPHDFLFVSTFTVVEATSKPHSPFSVISAQSNNVKAKGEPPFSFGEDFVNIIVKDRYVYKVGKEWSMEGGDVCVRLSACFM